MHLILDNCIKPHKYKNNYLDLLVTFAIWFIACLPFCSDSYPNSFMLSLLILSNFPPLCPPELVSDLHSDILADFGNDFF